MENRGRLRLLVTTGSEDLLHGLQRYDLWGRIGFMEIKRRYRRTLIGPFWSTISLAVFIAVMSAGLVCGLWKQTVREYMPFLATGMMVWLLISTMINESCTLFINSQHLFSRMRIDYSILAFALVWRIFWVSPQPDGLPSRCSRRLARPDQSLPALDYSWPVPDCRECGLGGPPARHGLHSIS